MKNPVDAVQIDFFADPRFRNARPSSAWDSQENVYRVLNLLPGFRPVRERFLSINLEEVEKCVLAGLKDVHLVQAAVMFGVQPQRVTKEMRRVAKAFNFWSLYGGTEEGASCSKSMELLMGLTPRSGRTSSSSSAPTRKTKSGSSSRTSSRSASKSRASK